MLCMELFNENNMNIEKIFNDTKNIFIEAGTKQSWAQYMNSEDVFIGLKVLVYLGLLKMFTSIFKLRLTEL